MQKRGTGTTIRYALTDTPLDRILVARTAAGLCAVAFGERDEDLLRELHDRYPEATVCPAPDGLRAETDYLLLQLTRGADPQRDLPVPAFDLAGTPFQASVWAATQAVPRGRTMTYGELAANLGLPRAARAVGAALGSNPLAVLIPCHRLVARDGALHAFRWGLDRKRRLLAIEGSQTGANATGTRPTQGDLCFGDPERD